MTEQPGILVTGASGRMGQMLIQTVLASDSCRLLSALERPGHPWIGQDLGTAMGQAPLGVTVTDDPVAAVAKVQGILDFTAPQASVELADLAAQARAVHVIGTTGFDDDQLHRLSLAARHATQIRAGNMSLGVNLLVQLTQQVAAALGEEYDIEIVEAHHNRKVDAPSGTALMLGEAAAKGRGRPLAELEDRGRDGITGPRQPGAIGFAALRGGDIIGEHDVIFAGPGERITLRHVASDRHLFAKGALRAVLWGQGVPPGAYDMLDVLGLPRG